MTNNIVQAVFAGKNRTVTTPLWQYDYGQILRFADINLPQTFEVHFANAPQGKSVTQLGSDGAVLIPDVFLLSGEPVYVWIYLHAGESDGETQYAIKIPVTHRASITDERPTPEQQDVIAELILGLNKALDEAQEARDEWADMSATAYTVPAGEPASASYENGLLTLQIPAGEKGEKGADGERGEQGEPGERGEKGEDGVSPTVTIEDIPGGHRITFTDAEHPEGQSFDVMDGRGDTVDWSDIQNVPADLVRDAHYNHTDENFSSLDKTKLDDLEPIYGLNADEFELDAEGTLSLKNTGGLPPTLDEVLEQGNTSERSMTVGDLEVVNTTSGNSTQVDAAALSFVYNYEGIEKRKLADIMYDGIQFAHLEPRSGSSGGYEIVPDFGLNASTGSVHMNDVVKQGLRGALDVPDEYDDTALTARVAANEAAIANRYTKAETDAKIAEAIDDVDLEHFHVVTALPDPQDADPAKRPIENHEYVLVTYGPDGTTVVTEVHYLYYDGAYHERTVQLSLEGYATEEYVDAQVDGVLTVKPVTNPGKGEASIKGAGASRVWFLLDDHKGHILTMTDADGNVAESSWLTETRLGDILDQRTADVLPEIYEDYTYDAQIVSETHGHIIFSKSDAAQKYVDMQIANTAFSRTLTEPLATTDYVDEKAVPEYGLWNQDAGGNVVQKGRITIEGTEYGIFEFYYKTGALPNATTKVYPLTNALANFTVKDFIDATGITSDGVFIGNGRTDNDNRVIVQQFSKNSKTITLRAYQDFTRQTATLKIQFIGQKIS